MRKAVAILAVVCGLVLIAIPFTHSFFDRTADAERILDRFEFLTLDRNPARYLDEAETTRAGSMELVDQAIPAFASEAGIGERKLYESFPALAAARSAVPEAHDFSLRYSEQLDAVDEKFQAVYDIPISSVPISATPWLFVLGGLGFLVAGLLALRTTGNAAIVAILVLGCAALLGPLAADGLGKAADSEDVKVFASRGLTVPAAAAAQEASVALDELVQEADERLLAHLARGQGISEGQLRRRLSRRFPAASSFLTAWREIGPRLSSLADAVSDSVADFESAKKLPISFPVWLLLAVGLATTVSAASALLRAPR